jgi:hypothetical protein
MVDMPEKRINIESALKSKGFKQIKKRDHDKFYLVIDEKISHISTKISTGSNYKTIGDNLLIQMYKQLRMNNKDELKKFIGCKYSLDDYKKSLKANNHI